MMDGVPNRGDDPNSTLVMEAVGRIGKGYDICSDGGDQADNNPNQDTLAT